MDIDPLLSRMASFPSALDALLLDVSSDDARWRPRHGGWSILEIVSHLVEEEFRDFRTRLALTLDDPTMAWPPIDPEGWARLRGYNDGDLMERLDAFTVEREASLRWLRSLESPDWRRA
ncbi:MAG: DinB family protein, partial [Phycisphaerales bacterium]|nr:DinB family protein [Phycisphaerales bacterium]